MSAAFAALLRTTRRCSDRARLRLRRHWASNNPVMPGEAGRTGRISEPCRGMLTELS